MLKHVAVRLKRQYDGKVGFELQNATVLNSNLESRDPALRNIIESLHRLGMSYYIDGCRVFWFQIDDDREPEWYEELQEVECAFITTWFEEEKKKINHLSGADYFAACDRLAESLTLKDQERDLTYVLPSQKEVV